MTSAFKWSYGEMAPTITGLGYDWAIEQTGKALEELIELVRSDDQDDPLFTSQADERSHPGHARVRRCPRPCRTPASIASSWTRPTTTTSRTPSCPTSSTSGSSGRRACSSPTSSPSYLTDKDREAIANPFRFRGQKQALRARRPRLPGTDGRDLHRVPPGHQAGRRHDRHVHPQGERGLGRPGHGAREGRVRHHGVLADQHRGRGQPAHQGEVGRQEHDLPRLPAPRGTASTTRRRSTGRTSSRGSRKPSASESPSSRRRASAAWTCTSPPSARPCRSSARTGRSGGAAPFRNLANSPSSRTRSSTPTPSGPRTPSTPPAARSNGGGWSSSPPSSDSTTSTRSPSGTSWPGTPSRPPGSRWTRP